MSDLVGARDCAGTQNPIASLANNVLNISKHDAAQPLWSGQGQASQGGVSAGDLVKDFQMFNVSPQQGIDQIREFNHPQLKDFTTALAHSHISQRPVAPIPLPTDTNLTAIDRQKILDRATALARHQFPDASQEELLRAQIASIERAVGGNSEIARFNGAFGNNASGGWANEFQQFQRPLPTVANSGNSAVISPQFQQSQTPQRTFFGTPQTALPPLLPIQQQQFLPQQYQQFQQFPQYQQFQPQQQNQQNQQNQQRAEMEGATTAQNTAPQTAQQANREVGVAEEIAGLERAGEHAAQQMLDSLPDDPKLKNSEFVKFMRQVASGEVVLDEKEWQAKLKSFDPQNISPEVFQRPLPQPGVEWVNSATDATHLSPEELAQENAFINEFYSGQFQDPLLAEEGGVDLQDWTQQYADYLEALNGSFDGNPIVTEERGYHFQPERPYEKNTDPFEVGMFYFQRGNLSEAILCFEEDVQRHKESSRSWMWLGLAQAENDDDVAALVCLRKAVECDENDLEAYMALATSATNELTRAEALNALVQFLRHNEKYAPLAQDLPVDLNLKVDPYKRDTELHAKVVDAFIAAARSSPNLPDADIQIALGLLFNMSHEYEKAVDCFRTATRVRGDDYLLWNKLGATLANSSRSEEALEPYGQALSLKPTYIRAQVNLGIAFLNLNKLPEAASQFLKTLNALHGSGNSARTLDGVWTKLKTVFLAMERYDLVDLAASRNVDLFRGEFQF